jgi:hypothetical protein
MMQATNKRPPKFRLAELWVSASSEKPRIAGIFFPHPAGSGGVVIQKVGLNFTEYFNGKLW